MKSTWHPFAAEARRTIMGAAAVAELLAAILDGEIQIVAAIQLQHPENAPLHALIDQAAAEVMTFRGRVDVRRLVERYLMISQLPIDDLAVRRAYERWAGQDRQPASCVA